MDIVTKDELRQYRSIRQEVIELKKEIDELELMAVAPKTQKYDSGVGAGGFGDVVSSVVCRLHGMKQMYLAKIACLLAIKEHIENAVQELPIDDRRLIRLHYFQGRTWEEIAVAFGMSWRAIHYRHRLILAKLGGYEDESSGETESRESEGER